VGFKLLLSLLDWYFNKWRRDDTAYGYPRFLNVRHTPPFLSSVKIVSLFCGFMVYGVYRHFQQYFSYIVAVSCIGGGIQSTDLSQGNATFIA
jgi:hypothetical protein